MHFPQNFQLQRYRDRDRNLVGRRLRELHAEDAQKPRQNQHRRNEEQSLPRHRQKRRRNRLANRLALHIAHHDPAREGEGDALQPQRDSADLDHARILKEYVDGPTIYELVLADQMQDDYLEQIRRLAKRLAAKRLNINYFPTNFVVEDGVVHYIDFECKPYKDTWDFENWGVKYWSKTPEFLAYVAEHTQRDPQGAGAEG